MCVRSSLILRLLCPVLLLLAGSVLVFAQTPRKIAFAYGNGGFATHITVINEDGTGQTILTDGNDDRDPSWSPDGSQIVFSGSRFGGVNIIRMNADGTGQVPLTNTLSPVSNMQPAWSPDGTKIVFTSSRAGAGRNEIWVMNADGTNPVRLTVNVQLGADLNGPFYGLDLGPTWSPDGTKIAFSSRRNGSANPEIYVMNADGSNQTRLTNNSFEDDDPTWTRSGDRITFNSSRNGKTSIFVINPDGSNEQKITDGFQPDWAPDGHRLAFTDRDPLFDSTLAIYLADEQGANRVRLTSNGIVESAAPAWQQLGGPVPPPPPTQPTFTVTGTVVDSSGVSGAVPGITITLSGSSSQSTTTDATGKFAFANLPVNGSFTVTPSNSSWRFSPASTSFSTTPPLVGFNGKNIDLHFDATPIFVQFVTSSYRGLEGFSTTILVERAGSILGTSTIQYSVTSGTAEAGKDFVSVSGTLTFNPFESTKSFQVPLIYDKLVEQPETVTLTLTNPTGGLVRGRQTSELVINDPPPVFALEQFTGLAIAVNADTLVRDPFPLTTQSILAPTQTDATRVAFFASFVDLLPSENFSAVTVIGFNATQATFNLPVEFVGKVPGFDDLTQINVVLPNNLPSGELFLKIQLHGNESGIARIRIQ
ncbi:MAG TPA: Calx-beta domain-containing protein [Pyrinomonadaceae bacterium]|nr:Calx-beta domain-containing protein [Pyrinomonadaceae bacterium]